MTMYQQRLANLVVRVQREFLETDDAISAPELEERIGIDKFTCAALVDTLVDAGVITQVGDRYVRAGGRSPGGPPAPRSVAA